MSRHGGRNVMTWLRTLTLTTLMALVAALPARDAAAQTLKDVLGAWTLVAVTVEQGEKKIEPYGANPKGSMIYDASGRFSITIKKLDDDDNLFESGIVNSLFAVQLMTFIERTFAIEVGMDDLDIENFKSLNATAAFVLKKNGRRNG